MCVDVCGANTGEIVCVFFQNGPTCIKKYVPQTLIYPKTTPK